MRAKHRWYQFSVRAMLIFTLLCAVACAWLGRALRRAAEEDGLIDAAQKIGGRVEVAYSGPDWLAFVCPRRLRRRVIGLSFDLVSQGEIRQQDLLPCLAGFPELEWLDFGVVSIDEEGLRHVASLKRLTSLILIESSITESGAAQLARLPNLQELNISGCRVDNAAIRKLADSPSLRRLMLRDADVVDELIDLGRLRGLLRLDLADCHLSVEPIAGSRIGKWLAGLDTLEELYLRDWPIQPGDIESISRLKNLRILDLAGCTVGVGTLQSLANLQQLKHLGLAPKLIDDETIHVLHELGQLETLSLDSGNDRSMYSVDVPADEALKIMLDKLNGVSRKVPENRNSPMDVFLNTRLPMLAREFPSVHIDTAMPRYPGMRCYPGQRVIEVPDLIGDENGKTKAGGGVF